jgi:hypothetical protein
LRKNNKEKRKKTTTDEQGDTGQGQQTTKNKQPKRQKAQQPE